LAKKEKKAKSEPKQKRLPGTEDAAIAELETAAEAYAEGRDERMALLKDEVEMKNSLLKLMHKYGKKTYNHAGIEIEVVSKDEMVRVKVQKDEE
jgi:hypothetical protein